MNIVENERKIKELQARVLTLEPGQEYDTLTKQIDELIKETYENLSAWDRVTLARDPSRPKASDFIEGLFHDFYEFHGDRCFGDDHAMIGELHIFMTNQ